MADNTRSTKSSKFKVEIAYDDEKSICQQFIDFADVAFYRCDPGGKLMFANRYFLEMHGYKSLEELNGTGATMHMINQSFNTLLETIHAKEIHETEMENIRFRHDGEIIFAREKVRAIKDSKGNLKYIDGTIIDISSQKKAEETLEQERVILNELLRNSPDLIVVKDTRGHILMAGKTISRFVDDNESDDIQGKTDFDIYPDKQAMEFFKEDQAIVRTGKPMIDLEHILQDKNGKKCWFSTTKLPLRKESGEVVGIIELSRDISTRKKERLALERAKKTAEEAGQLKTAFLANMSHEIRTPLNGIIGFAELLEKKASPGNKDQAYLKVIIQNGNQLLNIINDIIDIAKIESNQLDLNVQKFSVNDLIRTTLSNFQMYLDQVREDIKLLANFDLDDSNAFVVGDPVRVTQVLSNLVQNAIKFTDHGVVEFGYILLNKKWMQFYVKDTGIGMEPGTQEKIFERFLQADNSRTRSYGGAGLGLSISKSLVELMQGRLWLKSAPGQGSTFFFTIPYKPDDDSYYLDEQKPTRDFSWEGKKLLVVEDNPDSLFYIKEILTGTGIEIMHTSNAEKVCKIAASDHFDLILMDIRLPGKNGLEILDELRTAGIDYPVIAQTAHALSKEKEQIHEAGFTNCISKPYKDSDLLGMIKKYL